jgi:Fe(II)/alpha-ketoglutarate-dependent arginine beta-hydroxylase
MATLQLEKRDVTSIKKLVRRITGRYRQADDPAFVRQAGVYAHELPRGVRTFLHEAKLCEPRSAYCLVSGYPIDQERLGDTPRHWQDRQEVSPALEEEVLLVLFGSLLGDVFGWSTQQNGYLIHDVLPIRGHETEQLGSGSEQLLWWHTEDAFHPCRGDYVGLLCLRNPDRVATTFASLEQVELAPRQRELLFEPHFTIRPDESHLKKNQSRAVTEEWREQAYDRMEKMNSRAPKIAVLFGARDSPYLRLDPFFMDPPDSAEAAEALAVLTRQIDRQLQDLVLQPGDFLFIDNFQGVHGRKPFTAHFNGRDRWLKRINVTRDLRKSRDWRTGSAERILA